MLLYKRIENGNFRWPRTQEEALEISADQYQMLMQGLEIVARYPIEEISCPEFSLWFVQNVENKIAFIHDKSPCAI